MKIWKCPLLSRVQTSALCLQHASSEHFFKKCSTMWMRCEHVLRLRRTRAVLTLNMRCAYIEHMLCLRRTHAVLTSNTHCAYVEHMLSLQRTTGHEPDFVGFWREHKGSSRCRMDGFKWYLCSSRRARQRMRLIPPHLLQRNVEKI